MKSNFRNDLPIVNLYKRKYSNSKIETQLLFGDDFKVIKNYTDWKKIKIKSDGYTGFIKKKKFSKIIKPNYKVSVLKARLFSKPSINKKLKIFIPYQARLKVIEKKNKFSTKPPRSKTHCEHRYTHDHTHTHTARAKKIHSIQYM